VGIGGGLEGKGGQVSNPKYRGGYLSCCKQDMGRKAKDEGVWVRGPQSRKKGRKRRTER